MNKNIETLSNSLSNTSLLKLAFIFLCLNFISLTCVQAKTDEKTDTVTFIFASEMADINDTASGRYAELKTLVDTHRKENPYTFFIFGGGSIAPSALANLDRGAHIIDLLNGLEPDAMGVAKREYSFFEDELSLRAYEAAFPIITSNTIDKRTNTVTDGLVDYALIQKENVSVGVISIVHNRLIYEYLLKHTEVLSPQIAVEEKAKTLKRLGADYVVLHHFYPFEFIPSLMAEGVIDLAFMSNTRFAGENKKYYQKSEGIFRVKRAGQAIVVNVSTGDNPLSRTSEFVDLSTVEADLSLHQDVENYKIRLERLLNIPIGVWDGDYTTIGSDIKIRENAFANYVVDSMRKFANADVALVNSGSIRGEANYSHNEVITLQTIASELPYRSTLSVISISGKGIIDALENGFSGIEKLQGRFPHVSGMKVTYDSQAKVGQRVRSVTVNGKAIDEKAYYRLATSDYLAEGGDKYEAFTRAVELSEKRVDESILISDLIIRDVQQNGELKSRLDGRLIDLSKSR